MLSQNTWVGIGGIGSLILALTLHEWAHARVATWRGDTTAKDLGRLTINPIKHIHPVMTIMLPAFLWFVLPLMGLPGLLFGGAKPVPVVDQNLKSPARDMVFVAMAGPAMNFALALGSLATIEGLRRYAGFHTTEDLSMLILMRAVEFNILLTVFNLVPIPPLDGSRVLSYLLPPLRGLFRAFEMIGILLVLGFVFLVPGAYEKLTKGMSFIYIWMAGVVKQGFDLVG